MKKKFTPGTRVPSRTTWILTEAEVVKALATFVAATGESVPEGTRFVWIDDCIEQDTEGFATLGVDHENDEAD